MTLPATHRSPMRAPRHAEAAGPIRAAASRLLREFFAIMTGSPPPGRSRLAQFVLTPVVFLAGLPVVGLPTACGWGALMCLAIALEIGRPRNAAAPRFWPRGAWLADAGYAVAAVDLTMFHTGPAQTFGVTLFGVVMFATLVRHYAEPRSLLLNLAPQIAGLALVQAAAALQLTLTGHAPLIVTLVASPYAVFWVFKVLQNDLQRSVSSVREAALAAQKAARDAEEAYRIARMAEQLAGVGHWRFDVNTATTTWSDAIFEIYGLDADKGVPSLGTMLALYAPEDRSKLQTAFMAAMQEGKPYSVGAKLLTRDGRARHVIANGAAEYGSDGAISAVLGTLLDVTEAYERQADLDQSRSEYRLLAENSIDVIMNLGAGAAILYVSPSCHRYGYAPSELIGTNFLDYVHPDDLPALSQAAAQFEVSGEIAGIGKREYRLRTKDGSWIWFEGNPASVRDAKGALQSVVTSLRDISHRKALEADVLAAKEEAERANRAKSEFLANMSHELRTPLNAILGFSEMIQLGLAPDKCQTYSEMIHRSGHHLLSLINDILDLSKIEAGKMVLSETAVDLAQLIAECVSAMRPKASEGQLQLVLEIMEYLPPLRADARALRQILLNLISNAVKFTAPAGEVRVSAMISPAGELELCVRDTGVGIAEADLTRVFESFGQGRHDVVTAERGTGLGLPIVRGLVELHGGRIVLESTVHVGTAVTIWLPAARVCSGDSGNSRAADAA